MASPLTQTILKSQIFRSHPNLWQRTTTRRRRRYDSCSVPKRRITLRHLLLLPPDIRIRPRSLSIRHRNLLSNPPFSPLHQPCTPALRPHMSSLASPPDSTDRTKTVRIVIKGTVQGVFYRNWTVDNATELGLKGWVRNRRDGSVEALISGTPEKVQEMEQRCRRGPPAAMVTGLEVFPSDEDPGTGFERTRTV
ncbi:unnamed protein product [Ilex paraguariensis]|uniref:acylphosphatase n=1 Tax=Ilex paraguariensis TaxID=185542 RepID=A0ABC8UNH8_9AQUA